MNVLSQLAHVEILTPAPEESLRFFTDVLGLEESGREGGSVFLRGWGERFFHSLQLTEGDQPGLGHIAWRAEGPEDLQRAVERLEAAGVGEGWSDGSLGQGATFRYRGPGGHLHELFWEVERFVAPAGLGSRRSRTGRSGSCREESPRARSTTSPSQPPTRAPTPAWYRDTLGHRFMEYTVIPDRPDWVVFAMTTVCERAHDMGLVWDPSPVPGRINHLAYWVDSREELLRAADVLLNQDVAIEFGPGKHGMGEQDYLYFREPGGMRIELNSGGYRNYEPDFETVRFEPQQGSNVFYKNAALPHSMFESFPPVEFAPPRGRGVEDGDRALQLMRVLVVGGGIGGLSITIALRQARRRRSTSSRSTRSGTSTASGIIQPANAIRALDALGLAEATVDQGFAMRASRFHDSQGNLLAEIPALDLLGSRYPPMNGITRPRLHAIFQDAVRASGAEVRLGVTVTEVGEDGRVVFSDGSTGAYDLVVGADGIHSVVRGLAFPDAPRPSTRVRSSGATTCPGRRVSRRSTCSWARTARQASCRSLPTSCTCSTSRPSRPTG